MPVHHHAAIIASATLTGQRAYSRVRRRPARRGEPHQLRRCRCAANAAPLRRVVQRCRSVPPRVGAALFLSHAAQQEAQRREMAPPALASRSTRTLCAKSDSSCRQRSQRNTDEGGAVGCHARCARRSSSPSQEAENVMLVRCGVNTQQHPPQCFV